jgi:hypothetical protein
VATDYLHCVRVRVELAGDAVEQADGTPDEQQLRRYVSDACAQLEAETSEVHARLLPLAAEHHPDDHEQGVEICVVYG